jgi:hypothetical protein
MLENRLDKAMIKYNEAQSIRKTYEHIVKRLQDERLSFDNQLATFEKTLKAKKQDALELEMMSRDANHAKEVAKVGLFLSCACMAVSALIKHMPIYFRPSSADSSNRLMKRESNAKETFK